MNALKDGPPKNFKFEIVRGLRCPEPLTLLVAAVALPRLDLRPGVLLHVLRERAPHVVRLLELPLLVAPHVTLVRARVDQLAVTLLLCHAQVTPLCFTSFPDGKTS